MPSKNPAQRLRDIIENIGAIEASTASMEATRRLPPDMKDQHPEIDWTAVAAPGNLTKHKSGVNPTLQ